MLRIVFLFSLIFVAFSCGFQKLEHPPLQHLKAKNHEQPDTGRSLQQVYENIRFHVDYSYLEAIDPVQRDYIQNQIMPSAISYYQTALQIIRSSEGVQVDIACGGYDPPAYMVDPGVDADLIILVAAENMPDVDFVAAAVPCGLSLTDNRPNYGLMLWNLAFLPMAKATDDQENLSTALHELAHIIGFNPDVFGYFRNPETGETLTGTVGTKQVNGWNVTYLNVEPLTSRLRAYFGCDTLEGAYLEDEGETGSIGSHFERRVFMNEYMTASSITEPVISEFTLALFEGSGWYRPNYNMTEPFSWGRGQGCGFLDSSCINDQGGPAFPQFCNVNAPFGCSYTSRGVGFCTLDSPDYFANNCPYYIASPQTDCEDPSNQANAYITAELYGPNSRCFTGTLVDPIYMPTSGAFCFPTRCTSIPEGFTLTLTVNGVDIACPSAGPVSIEGYSGQLDCPDPNEFCSRANPVFCEKGCSGRGTCVDNVCQCPPGWTGVDCAQRSFDAACTRCESETGTGCFGDQCVLPDQVGAGV